MTRSALESVSRAALEVAVKTGERNEAIREARAEGHSLRTIAEAAGLSHTAVANIVAPFR